MARDTAGGGARKPILSMHEAVLDFTADGDEVLLGGFAYSDPFAFAHELIRQHRKRLRIIKGSGGVLVDQLIGAGCVDQLLFCHVWNSVGPEPAHCFRRAAEHDRPAPVAIEEMSFGAFTSSLVAGACAFPFMPTTPIRGAGQYIERVAGFLPHKFATIDSPFDGRPVTVVAPLQPRLGVFHVQRADWLGNGQIFGPVADTRFAAAACERVLLVTEELVDTSTIRQQPELTVIPSFMVDGIVVEPWAAHPTDSYGYYWRDLEHHRLYGQMSKTEDGFAAYVDEWILATGDHAGVRRKLGEGRMRSLMARPEVWW
jgi:glutaconate CoA-transferase, subunit A